jgi:hypothetical protein
MGAPKGHPRFGGRKPGAPNKVTAEVRDLARVHGPSVLEELARLALILDRAYGKCAQPISGDEGGPTILRVITGVRG